jgi:hypothetical protein
MKLGAYGKIGLKIYKLIYGRTIVLRRHVCSRRTAEFDIYVSQLWSSNTVGLAHTLCMISTR